MPDVSLITFSWLTDSRLGPSNNYVWFMSDSLTSSHTRTHFPFLRMEMYNVCVMHLFHSSACTLVFFFYISCLPSSPLHPNPETFSAPLAQCTNT